MQEWEQEVRFNLARRRDEGLGPYQELRKARRNIWLLLLIAAAGWMLVAALVWGR